MIGEIDFYGVFVPSVLVLMLVAYLVSLAGRWVFERLGLYRFIWHRSIFDLGIYVIVLGGGLSNMQHLYAEVPPLMAPHVFGDVARTPIVQAKHGDSSGVFGAARLWDAA